MSRWDALHAPVQLQSQNHSSALSKLPIPTVKRKSAFPAGDLAHEPSASKVQKTAASAFIDGTPAQNAACAPLEQATARNLPALDKMSSAEHDMPLLPPLPKEQDWSQSAGPASTTNESIDMQIDPSLL